MKKIIFLSAFILSACVSKDISNSEKHVILAEGLRARTDQVEAVGVHHALSTQGKFSTAAAQDVLEKGGNLIDAAVAASLTLAVERPQSTGLTGGGFLLFREAKTGNIYAIDFRERAPLKANEKMFLGPDGKPKPELSRASILATGVPGLVAGLYEIHQKFGKIPWAQTVAPAIRLAEQGFPVYPQLARALETRQEILLSQTSAKAIFTKDGKTLKTGDLLVQKDLAGTLRFIAKMGRDGFYKGPVAQKFLDFFKKQKGLIGPKDFASYRVHWREPVRGTYQNYEVVSMPPPSSGGVHVIQFLNFLENDHLKEKGFLSAESIHLAAASLQSAFADRAKFMGDPDFMKIPVKALTTKSYAKQRRSEVADSARHYPEVQAGNPVPFESNETTHFSMMDLDGNMIASTQTINGYMGSGLVVPETGLVLNNEMDDFSARVGDANMFGAIGGEPNSVQPQKTPLSSMAPTLVLKNNQPYMAVGAPGGTRIISCVAQTILNVLEFQLPLYESIASIRYHHQWQPDILILENPGPGKNATQKLEKMTYKIEMKPIGCHVMAVRSETGEDGKSQFRAVSDPRDIGTSEAR